MEKVFEQKLFFVSFLICTMFNDKQTEKDTDGQGYRQKREDRQRERGVDVD